MNEPEEARGLPQIEQLLGLVERLEGDNELLRQRVLEVMEWVEEAATTAATSERERMAWQQQAEQLRTEIEAIHASRGWRFLAKARAAYVRIRPNGHPSTSSNPLPKLASSSESGMIDEVPVFVPVRDRVTPLRALVDWLERAGHEEIWLVDNASTYPPLVEYLEASPHHVVRLGRNFGHRAPWLSGTVQRVASGRYFVITDPDIVPDDGCPLDAVDHFRSLLDRYPSIDKVGFGLRIDDLPGTYPLAAAVREWEARFWREEVEPGVFRADIDTTFALYRPLGRRHQEDRALRTGAPYVARHLPWYANPAELSEDDLYYRDHADTSIANWDRDELPRWKQRWLDQQRED